MAVRIRCVTEPASASTASRACQAVAGKSVVKTPSIRVVSRRTPGRKGRGPTTTYYGCDRSAGPVRRLGHTRGFDPSPSSPLEAKFGIVKTAGRFVLYRQFKQDDPAGIQQDTRVVIDLRSGGRREVWRFHTAESTVCEEDGIAYFPRPKQFVLGSNGVVAGVYVPSPSDEFRSCYTPSDATVVLASVPGQSRLIELDRGPVADIPSRSLKLTGRTVGWTHGTEQRSATV